MSSAGPGRPSAQVIAGQVLSSPVPTAPVQVLLLSGPAGVGKSTLGWEIAAQLRRPRSPGTGRARGHGNDMTGVPGDWSATKAAGAQERGMEGVA